MMEAAEVAADRSGRRREGILGSEIFLVSRSFSFGEQTELQAAVIAPLRELVEGGNIGSGPVLRNYHVAPPGFKLV